MTCNKATLSCYGAAILYKIMPVFQVKQPDKGWSFPSGLIAAYSFAPSIESCRETEDASHLRF